MLVCGETWPEKPTEGKQLRGAREFLQVMNQTNKVEQAGWWAFSS